MSDLTWQPNWIATCFAGARCRIADGGDPVSQNTEAELTILHVLQECPDGCSLDKLRQLVLLRLRRLGYHDVVAQFWVDERIEVAWEMFRKQKENTDDAREG